MDNKKLIMLGLVWLVVQALVNCGIFVTFPQMTAYAVSKDNLVIIEEQLNRIEGKLDKLMGY